MMSEANLRRLGLENSGPLRPGHPELGLPGLFCKCPIQARDEVGHIPQDPEDERSATLVAHWKCIEDGFNRLRGSRDLAPGATRRFLESWAGVVKGGDAGARLYASQADFILKHGRAFEWRALPHGVRMGAPRQCFRNARSSGARYRTASEWGLPGSASATLFGWLSESRDCTRTWRATPSTRGWRIIRWRMLGASIRSTSWSIPLGRRTRTTSACLSGRST